MENAFHFQVEPFEYSYEGQFESDDEYTFEGEMYDEFENDGLIGEVSIKTDNAVKKNQTLMKSLGWQPHYNLIASKLLGFKTPPAESDFAQAVAEWQHRLCFSQVDGIIGSQSWAEMKYMLDLVPAPAPTVPIQQVNSLMPKGGLGFCCHKPQERRYGLPETVVALMQVGMLWFAKHPQGPRMRISDISKRGGGKFPPHKSHRVGLDIDIWLMRNDGKEGAFHYIRNSSVYSRTLTQELVDTIRNNGILPVKCIFFEDSKVTGVRGDGAHFDHMHVRFCMPARYKGVFKVSDAYPEGKAAAYECPPFKC